MPIAGGISIHNDAMHNGNAARDTVNGVCGLDGSGDALISQSAPRTIDSMKNISNGLAGLDAGGKVEEAQLPTIFRGIIFPFAGSAAPTGFLMCDGVAVSRATYADLFTIIGTNYGVGNGTTTFNLPNMQGNVPVGIGVSPIDSLGDVGGEQTHTLIVDEMPSHTHVSDTNSNSNSSGGGQAGNLGTAANGQTSEPTGGDGTHNNMQPYLGVNYIIKT